MVVKLENKVALVTGGSAGLGAAIVEALAAKGCHLVINYSSSQERAEVLAKAVAEKYGVKAVAKRGDVSSQEVCEALVEETVKEMGQVDLVVSNAGWTRFIPFSDIDDITPEDLDKCFGVNVKAHFYLFRSLTKHVGPEGASFIVTSSIAGIKQEGSSIPYGVSKAGLNQLVKCLAKAGTGIRINAICPGLLKTEWGMKFGEEQVQAREKTFPLQRCATLEDTAAMFVALAENTSMTGGLISVDSGQIVL
ncbi:probable NADP-dependent mannitol dehydrogenase [Trichomonascus vanleenenianus]|uniref:SDR family NAD(P)-dependent oxidoreductase n=1 Tax=Trichomonascus vanleenenianus TaxID=2268995 RepID=UPI003EC965D1